MNRNYCLEYHGNPPMSVEELMDIQPQQVELQMGPDIGLCQDFYFSGSGGNNLKLEKQEQLMWKQQDYMYNESDTIHVLNSSDHFQQEHQEIDQCLRLQSEQLKSMLLEKTQKQMTFMAKKMESRVQTIIRQKDHEMAVASNRTNELQRLLRSLETEIQGWQKVTQQKRDIAISLSNTLNQFKERGGVGDVESIGDNGGDENDDILIKPCRRCSSDSSCMVFLPCRHLCSCKACESYLESCPICGTTKKATIEALIL